MSKYVYPAIFTEEENGQYSVRFPDVKNCFTGADSLSEALIQASDVLNLMLYAAALRENINFSGVLQDAGGAQVDLLRKLIIIVMSSCLRSLHENASAIIFRKRDLRYALHDDIGWQKRQQRPFHDDRPD